MKCVKNLETLEIKRVDDSVAQKRVMTGDWMYVPKSAWKAVTRVVKEDKELREKFPANVEGSVEFKVAVKKEPKKKKERVAEEKQKTQKGKKKGK